ncbi:MAG TPA: hypothetical protein VNF08_03830 [Acidimicrobiales bacterium]|nr:hypothetical protein [Acidimicrobiales bacterium]
MILEQVRSEMNQVNWVLDEFDSVEIRKNDKARKSELLHMAALASIRGIQALQDDVRTREPFTVEDKFSRDVREVMRQDDALVKQFARAECRLLEDLGVSPGSVNRIQTELDASLARILNDEALQPGAVEEQLSQMIASLETAMSHIEDESEHRRFIQKLKGAFVALAGGMVVTSNGLIGAGLAPVTGGISIAGAALSGAVGQDLVTRGIDIALGKD